MNCKIRIRSGKTEVAVANELIKLSVKLSIPKSDIVFVFDRAEHRKYTDFAVS
ncbi:element excision factor XisI family protein [Baaleninema simplex]|uniref:element excision factor XisI family protein n=1 Tax=Baaleninema simplex TaxID=2862350 RepID=UPI000A072F65